MTSIGILCRALRPRRIENALNVLLTLVLLCMVFYFYQKLGFFQPKRLPPEEGHTWPTTTIEMHVRPNPGEVRKGWIF
jgi:hypothetical protein